MTPPTQQLTPVSPSPVLHAKLAAGRRKHLGVAAGTGLAMTAGVFVILLGAITLLDWWLDLPLTVRSVLLLLLLAITGAFLWRFVLGPLRRQPDDDTVALAV